MCLGAKADSVLRMQNSPLSGLHNTKPISQLHHRGGEVQEAEEHGIDGQRVAVRGWLVSRDKPGPGAETQGCPPQRQGCAV